MKWEIEDTDICFVVNKEDLQELIERNFKKSMSEEDIIKFIEEVNTNGEIHEEIRVLLVDQIEKALGENRKNPHYSI